MSYLTIKECIQKIRPLDQIREAEIILCHILKVSKEQLFAYPHPPLDPQQLEQFSQLWQRFRAGEPLAYILGKIEFYGLELTIDARALIPRQETEELVGMAIKWAKSLEKPNVLDIGTGSGAIALALQKNLPQAKVMGCDISKQALELARLNAKGLGLEQVEFVESDLLKATDLESDVLKSTPWDLMVANLPYIGKEKFNFVEKSVIDHEPHTALFGGKDGLELYRRLFEQINCSKSKPKCLMGEFGSLQRKTLESIIQNDFPQAEVSFYQDCAGLDRFFSISPH